MRFVNKSLPDGVYAGHAVLDGFTEDYPEAHAAKLVPILSRCYGLMPEGDAPPAVVKALVEFELAVPVPEEAPVVVPDPNIEGREPKPNPDDEVIVPEGKEPKPNPDEEVVLPVAKLAVPKK